MFINKLKYIAAACLLGSTAVSAANYNVVIVAGQSNAEGREANQGAIAECNNPSSYLRSVPFAYHINGGTTSAGWADLCTAQMRNGSQLHGIEVTLADNLVNKHGEQNLAIFKFTQGGTGLNDDWRYGGMFSALVTEWNTRKQELVSAGHTVNVTDFHWIQGEKDARKVETENPLIPVDRNAQAYANNLYWLADQVKATFGANVNMTVAKLSTSVGGSEYPYESIVIAKQEEVAAHANYKDWVKLAETCSLTKQADAIHYDEDGLVQLANEMYTVHDVRDFEGEIVSYSLSSNKVKTVTSDNDPTRSCASGGLWRALQKNVTNPTGEYIQLALPHIDAGSYELWVRYKESSIRGIMKVTRGDGTLIGTIDQSGTDPGTTAYKLKYVGNVSYGGYGTTKPINFVIDGTSGTGYDLSIDEVILIKK